MSLMTIVLLGLTALIAGLIPTLLFFGTAADKRVVILGGLAVTLAYLPPALGLPALVAVGANGLQFYPAWAILIAFPVAAVWKLVQRAGAPPKTEEEQAADPYPDRDDGNRDDEQDRSLEPVVVDQPAIGGLVEREW